jgi:stalled ribosome alternative rescue factor ArfA
MCAAWKEYIDEKGTLFRARAIKEKDGSKGTYTYKCKNMHWTVIDTQFPTSSWY